MNAIEHLPELLREALGDDLKIARDEFANVEDGAPPCVLWRVTDDASSDRITFELECRSQMEKGGQMMGGHIHSYLEKTFGKPASDRMVQQSSNLRTDPTQAYVTHFMELSLPAELPD